MQTEFRSLYEITGKITDHNMFVVPATELKALEQQQRQAPAQAAPVALAGPIGYGPKVTVKRSCSDCKACNSESYAVQGDSGHYVYCEHPSLPESKYIGDTNWNTPHWCPVAAPTTQPAPPQEAGSSDPSITLDFKMASELLDMFGGEPGLVTLQHGGEKCHSGAGLYAWHSDLPEEGAAFLGAEPHDEAAPTTQQAGEVRPVTPYTCPKCHALWLHWPAEQTGFGCDTLNCRSADHCHYCEKAGVEQLQRLERIPAALHAPQPSPTAQGDALDAAFEALRKRLCKLPRYSFALDSRSNLRRCEDKSGNWIEFDAVHALFDPVAIDAARAAQEDK